MWVGLPARLSRRVGHTNPLHSVALTYDSANFHVPSCDMSHMGSYKVKFENETGEDESTGKVTIKPVNTPIQCANPLIHFLLLQYLLFKHA